MQLIDSHSHLDFSQFDKDRLDVVSQASDAGISDIIVSATTAKRWANIKVLCEKHPQCHPAYGLHPMFMNEHKLPDLDNLQCWIKTEKPVALGEIGLDYFIPEAQTADAQKAQLALFIAQLEIANEHCLPIIIHARKSLDSVLKQLRRLPKLTGLIHSFSGSEQQAKQLIELGFYLSFGGPITYTRATRLRKLVAKLPLESLLLETDSPDQPDAMHYKQRNEPAYLQSVAETVAELRNISVEEVAQTTTQSAKILFKI